MKLLHLGISSLALGLCSFALETSIENIHDSRDLTTSSLEPLRVLVAIDRTYQVQSKQLVALGIDFAKETIAKFNFLVGIAPSVSVGILDLGHYSAKWLSEFSSDQAAMMAKLDGSKTKTIFGGTLYGPILDKYADIVYKDGEKSFIILISDGQSSENYKTLGQKKKLMKKRLGTYAPSVMCFRTRYHKYGTKILANICDKIYFPGTTTKSSNEIASALINVLQPQIKDTKVADGVYKVEKMMYRFEAGQACVLAEQYLFAPIEVMDGSDIPNLVVVNKQCAFEEDFVQYKTGSDWVQVHLLGDGSYCELQDEYSLALLGVTDELKNITMSPEGTLTARAEFCPETTMEEFVITSDGVLHFRNSFNSSCTVPSKEENKNLRSYFQAKYSTSISNAEAVPEENRFPRVPNLFAPEGECDFPVLDVGFYRAYRWYFFVREDGESKYFCMCGNNDSCKNYVKGNEVTAVEVTPRNEDVLNLEDVALAHPRCAF